MKKLFTAMLFWVAALPMFGADVAAVAEELAAKVTPGTITYRDENGGLYSKNELAHLAKGELAGGQAAKKSACAKPANADPIPALAAFNAELAARGIKLIVLPVPPKLAIEPCAPLKRAEAMVYLRPFYQELREQGIDVLDISESYVDPEKHYFCRTDAHWNLVGIAAAADELAKRIPLRGNAAFKASETTLTVSGDLAKSLDAQNPETEQLPFTPVDGKTIDANSPVLLIGDSHTLVFSTGGDMLAEHGGLAEQLAVRLQMPIDRIGVKGSAATAVRVDLYRKAVRDPRYLENKRFVIYCFSCREFTESTSGWVKVPVGKK